MNLVDVPAKFPIPWANNAGPGFIRPIPEASQIGVNAGYASLYDGFVPLNATPTGAGGIPPFIQDFNGILNQVSAWARWLSAGGPVVWDAAFAASAGGYPKGAIVTSNANTNKWWVNQADGNMTNPDAGGANWQDFFAGIFNNPTLTGNIAMNGPTVFGNTVNLGGNATATTQAFGDNTTKVATDAFVQSAIGAESANFTAWALATFAPLTGFSAAAGVYQAMGWEARAGSHMTGAPTEYVWFPTRFTTACDIVVCSIHAGGAGTFTCLTGAWDYNGFVVTTRVNGVDSAGITVDYIAFGR